MKKKLFTFCLALFAICGCGIFLLTGCGEQNFDVNKVTIENTTSVYDGQAKSVKVENVPDWVKTSVAYYADESHEESVSAPVDAGTYYVVVSFANDKGNKLADDKVATLIIEKADFTEIEVTVSANYTITEIVDNVPQEVEKSVVASVDEDGEYYFEYNSQIQTFNVRASVIADGNSLSGGVYYYNAKNPDGTFDENNSVQSNPVLQNVGDKLYLNMILNDKNHNTYNLTKEVVLERITVREIKTYEDLCAMYDDINNDYVSGSEQVNNAGELRWRRWVLKNDIDCQGNVWKVIGSAYFADNEGAFFIGEFDGNGHTIRNLKITNDSVENINATNGINVGLFGYAASAYVHDVNFENASIEIDTNATDKTEAYAWSGINPVYAGVVIGRAGSAHDENRLENINVKNSKINIDAYKSVVGGIIGFDEYNYNHDNVTRNNLDLENVDIFAINKSEHQNQRVVVGGLVGDVRCYTTSYFSPITYSNCDLRDVNIGFDYASWNYKYQETNEIDNEFISNAGFVEYYVAGFVAYVRGPIVFNKCTLENYNLATDRTTGYFSFKDAQEAVTITFEECSQTEGEGEFAGVWFGGEKRTDVVWTEA